MRPLTALTTHATGTSCNVINVQWVAVMPSEYEKEIGARVAAQMKHLGYTPPQLAQLMGMTSPSSIRKIMTGENIHQWTQLAKLASALNTSPDYLLGLGSEGLDPNLAQVAVQGLLEQLGYDREMARLGARLAVETAREHRVLLEDPETEVRLRVKLAASEARLSKSSG